MKQTMWLAAGIVVVSSLIARADDWPQWRGPQRDGVWREAGTIDKFPPGGPRVVWNAPVGGGYAGPAVADGRVFVTDRMPSASATRPSDPMDQSPVAGVERVICLSEADGAVLWIHEYECRYRVAYGVGPRATPAVDGDRVYTLGAEGHLKCLKVQTGEVVWEKHLPGPGGPTPVWGFAGHPLIDGDKLICLTSDREGIAAAFDKMTGEVLWTALPAKDPGYCPPMIFEFAGRRQLIIWHPWSVNALDPETGKVLWSEGFGPVRNNVSIVAPMRIGDDLFVTSYWDGALLLRPGREGVEVVWKHGGTPPRRTEALHSLMSAPLHRDGYVYGVCAGGQLRCIDLRDGKTMWETMDATLQGPPVANTTAFLVPNGDKVFISNDNGELIIAKLTPQGYEEIDRAAILEPTQRDGRRSVLWCHPAYANGSMYWRNDKQIVRIDLSSPQGADRR